MKIKETLNDLLHYYESTRQVGHTAAMIEGVANSPQTMVLVGNFAQGKCLMPKVSEKQVVPIGSISTALCDRRAPLVIDNAAMWLILHEAKKEIERLEAQVLAGRELANGG